MLHRMEGDGVILISQPAHAWVSGQLARHWSLDEFAPREEVCEAAALHDIGFLAWENLPTWDPRTGLPHSFLELPARIHLELWSTGIRQMSAYNRYSALLVSKHFTELCHHHPSDSTADRRLEEKFLAGQESLQDALVTSLRNDFFYEPHSTDEIIERNRQLVSLWDWISLLLCMGFHDERVVTEMSQARGLSRFALKPLDLQARRIAMKPWPFRGKSLRIVIEGRHLLKTFTEETAMRKALSAASPLTLEIELIRG